MTWSKELNSNHYLYQKVAKLIFWLLKTKRYLIHKLNTLSLFSSRLPLYLWGRNSEELTMIVHSVHIKISEINLLGVRSSFTPLISLAVFFHQVKTIKREKSVNTNFKLMNANFYQLYI